MTTNTVVKSATNQSFIHDLKYPGQSIHEDANARDATENVSTTEVIITDGLTRDVFGFKTGTILDNTEVRVRFS